MRYLKREQTICSREIIWSGMQERNAFTRCPRIRQYNFAVYTAMYQYVDPLLFVRSKSSNLLIVNVYNLLRETTPSKAHHNLKTL